MEHSWQEGARHCSHRLRSECRPCAPIALAPRPFRAAVRRMSFSSKRSASPLPRNLDEVFRPRILYDKKDDKCQSASTSLDAFSVREGQEVLSLSASLKDDLRHENVNDLILGTTIRLAREGKRLVRAPRLL